MHSATPCTLLDRPHLCLIIFNLCIDTDKDTECASVENCRKIVDEEATKAFRKASGCEREVEPRLETGRTYLNKKSHVIKCLIIDGTSRIDTYAVRTSQAIIFYSTTLHSFTFDSKSLTFAKMDQVMAEVRKIPPVTRFFILSSLGITLPTIMNLFSSGYFIPTLVFNKFQVRQYLLPAQRDSVITNVFRYGDCTRLCFWEVRSSVNGCEKDEAESLEQVVVSLISLTSSCSSMHLLSHLKYNMTHEVPSRSSLDIESKSYLHRSADFAWQTFWACGVIMVRPVSSIKLAIFTLHPDSHASSVSGCTLFFHPFLLCIVYLYASLAPPGAMTSILGLITVPVKVYPYIIIGLENYIRRAVRWSTRHRRAVQ